MQAGERVWNLERYYNNLVGFDAADDDLPDRFVEGADDAVPGQGGVEGSLVELDRMKDAYYDHRGWVDGVVTEEKLDELDIDVGPGTDVTAGEGAAPADD
jgi:aldehyde:ferredoxin oxidoreductase